MTTPPTRAIVSLVAALCVTLSSEACVGHQPHPDPMDIMQAMGPLTIRFDNGEKEYVHVYLIADQQQWLLGRVEPGAIATLRVPDASLVQRPRFVQLAIVPGGRLTADAARDPRVMFTALQPATELVAQRWAFSQGQLSSVGPRRVMVGDRSP